ncbi:MAG: GntR family transcriptional regulator [Clostridiales bacterium]|jgi:LacI family transcriptional regulator|nr:GntR family transcriptional regulator [Clostridiales bacterium]
MVYKEIYETLRLEIENGAYNENGVLPSEHALTERFDAVRETVRRAIRMLADEGLVVKRMGFGTVLTSHVAKAGAHIKKPQAAAAQRKNILFVTMDGHLSGDAAEQFHLNLSRLFERRLSEQGYNLVLKSVAAGERLKGAIDGARPAAVIFDSYVREDLYADALFAKLPCISVNHYTPLMTSIVSNNADGAYNAAKALMQAGHERVAYIIGKRNYQTCLKRLAGVQRLYTKNGKTLDERYIIDGDWSFGSGAKAGEYILNMPDNERPTAVFAFNDDMAYGCRSVFERNGVNVPDDVSIIGFDKSIRYDGIFAPITTVDVNLDAIVECAGWYLLYRLKGDAPQMPIKIQIETKIFDSGTVKNIKEI